ncbi:hypothetical protein KQX54_005074 [Cotesia glomerata]|uniref:Uncharacterized protein n=1 Tax=Cotesia glomerata TaxID=32391 RepID=A0AAV7HWZ5_COTGL|nr:hypothetical protein KQX54_005074 [Cotesia glomerata]
MRKYQQNGRHDCDEWGNLNKESAGIFLRTRWPVSERDKRVKESSDEQEIQTSGVPYSLDFVINSVLFRVFLFQCSVPSWDVGCSKKTKRNNRRLHSEETKDSVAIVCRLVSSPSSGVRSWDPDFWNYAKDG